MPRFAVELKAFVRLRLAERQGSASRAEFRGVSERALTSWRGSRPPRAWILSCSAAAAPVTPFRRGRCGPQ